MTRLFTLGVLLLLLSACQNNTSSGESTEEGFEGYSSTEVSIPEGVTFSTQITSKLDYSNRPTDDVSYIPPSVKKIFVHNNFTTLPNGPHKYQCNVSKGDRQGIVMGSPYDFTVENGQQQVWTWFEVSTFSGSGDYTMDVYLDGNLLIRKPLKVLSEADMASGNFVPYWNNKTLHPVFTSDNPDKQIGWRVREMAWTKGQIVSLNVVEYEGYNRFFIVTEEDRNHKLYEIQKTSEHKLLKELGYVSYRKEIRFHQLLKGNTLYLFNETEKNNTAINLVTGGLAEFDIEVETPIDDQYDIPDGSGKIMKHCGEGLLLYENESGIKLTDMNCNERGWLSWSRTGGSFYYEDGTGILKYDLDERTSSKILFDSESIHPVVFQNNGMEFISYARSNTLLVATQHNPNSWFVAENNYENKFRRLLGRTSSSSSELNVSYHDQPKKIMDVFAEIEAEGVHMLMYELGDIQGGDYDGGKLLRIHSDLTYYDKGSTELYNSSNPDYVISHEDRIIYLANHMNTTTANMNLSIWDPGFAFEKSEVFAEADHYLLDDVIEVPELWVEEAFSLDSVEFELVAKVWEYDMADLTSLGASAFYRTRQDDGSVNRLTKDGIRAVYQYKFPEAVTTPDHLDFARYEFYTTRDCMGARSDLASVGFIEEDELQEFGTLNGQPIFTFSNQNHSRLKSEYEDYETSLRESGMLDYQDGARLMTYDEFLELIPIFFWQDPFGRWVRFIHEDLLPPLACEPILYFYPEKEQAIKLQLGEGVDVMASFPRFQNGWDFMARPSGHLIDRSGELDHRIFWEGVAGLLPRNERGYVVARQELGGFLDSKLLELGLIGREIEEFKEAWLPEMSEKPFCFVSFYDPEIINKYVPMSITPKPETVIRVLMDFGPLERPVDVEAPEVGPTPKREGFTVVEWGGLKR